MGVGGAGSRRRHRIAVGAVVGLVGLAGGITIALAGDGNGPPQRHALLLHNVLSQVRLQAEAGFEDGLEQSGLTGSVLTIDETDAVATALTWGLISSSPPPFSSTWARRHRLIPTIFVAVDQVVDGSNITSVIVNSHEASYLAGVAVALTTSTGKVGFVGGVDEELIWSSRLGSPPASRRLTRASTC